MENFTLPNNLSECHLDDSSFMRKLLLCFYLAIVVLATPSNIFSLFVAWQHIRQKNELGVYLFNLALSDLLFAISISFWMDYLRSAVWGHGHYVCLLFLYISFTNYYNSGAFLCCIAVDRYLAVAHPFKYTFLRKVRTATVVSISIWVLVLFFNVSTITWQHTCDKMSPSCFDTLFPITETIVWICVARFVVGFIVPFFLVVFSTWGICNALKSNQATEERERKQIIKLLTVILLCVFLCFGPMHAIMLLFTLVGNCRNLQWFNYADHITMLITSLNTLADPLLYCFITETGKANVNQIVLFFQVKKRSKDQDVV